MSETPNLKFIQLACGQINVAHDQFVKTGRKLGSLIVSNLLQFFEQHKETYPQCVIRALVLPIEADGLDDGIRVRDAYEISKGKLYLIPSENSFDTFGRFCFIPESQKDKTYFRCIRATNHEELNDVQEILNLVFEIYFPDKRTPFINYLTGYSRNPTPR